MAALRRSVPPLVLALTACPPPGGEDPVTASEVDASTSTGAPTSGAVTDPGATTTTSEPDATSTGSTAAFAETTGGSETTAAISGTSTTAASTADASTTAASTADASTTDATSTTAASTTAADTADATSTTAAVDDGTSSDDGTSTGAVDTTTGADDTTTGGDDDAFACCAPGCTHTLAQGHPYFPDLIASGDRLVSHEHAEKTILWDRDTRAPLRVEYGWSWAMLDGALFALFKPGLLRWYDADDGALLGQTNDVGTARGLATDGSYLWVSDVDGLQILAPDGSELWFQPGAFSGGNVRALPGRVLAKPAGDPNVLVVIDLVAAAADVLPIQGHLTQWWSDDSGRFATLDGQAHRIYGPDATQLAAGLGSVLMGHGDLYITSPGDVRSLAQPNKILQTLPQSTLRSKNALFYFAQQSRVVALEQNQVVETILPPFQHYIGRFAYDAATFAFSGEDGYLAEGTGEGYTLGKFTYLDAARSGRLVAVSEFGVTHVWDIGGDCGVSKTGAIERIPRPIAVADGGDVLVAVGSGAPGTEFLALPGGAPLGFIPGGTWEMHLRASDDASLFSRRHVLDVDESSVLTFPAGDKWFSSQGSFPAYVSPDGQHASLTEPWQVYWNPEKGYVYGANGLVSVFDGVIYGFLDDERLIRGKHVMQGCNGFVCFPFLGADIVTLDGAVVQATTLPEVPGFQRISATELLVTDPPRIYDAYTGALLWSLPKATLAAAVGLDFVVTSDGGELIVHKWR